MPLLEIKDGKVVSTYETMLSGFPSGVILPYGGANAPAGWLICDGSAISRSFYVNLYNVIGTSYGAGDGVSTFNIPDLRGRVPVGIGGSGVVNRGDTGGEQTHTLVTGEIPSHAHTVYRQATGASGAAIYVSSNVSGSGNTSSGATGGGGAHNNMQPYQGVNYIIKT